MSSQQQQQESTPSGKKSEERPFSVSPEEELPQMIVSLGDSFHNRNQLCTRMSSSSSSCSKKRQFSFISLEGDCHPSDFEEDDDESVFDSCSAKKAKQASTCSPNTPFKAVGFYQGSALEQVQLIESLRDPSFGNSRELWWSRKELNQIQMQGRMDQAMDMDVQDFLQAHHRAHMQVLKNETCSLPSDVLNGIKEGLRGMESFSPLQVSRRRKLKEHVKSVIDAPKDKVAETSLQFSKAAQQWSTLLGEADHQAVTEEIS